MVMTYDEARDAHEAGIALVRACAARDEVAFESLLAINDNPRDVAAMLAALVDAIGQEHYGEQWADTLDALTFPGR